MEEEIAGPPVRGNAGIAGIVPFGLDATKPRHFREGLDVLWENRDQLGYAWRILNHGVCDGCSLGPRGLQDDVLPGLHLCMTRLKLLRQNTVGAFTPSDVADISRLRAMTNAELRALGRVPYPFLYEPGDRGFRRLSWTEALEYAGSALRDTPPERTGWFATSKGLTNETYYVLAKTARLLGTNNVDFCGRMCHSATMRGLEQTIGYGAPTCSLGDWIGTDLLLIWGSNLANNQPVAMKYLAAAKERGTRIVVINTVFEKGLAAYWIPSQPVSALFGTRLMDDFVQVKAGGDLALAHAVMKLLIRWDAVDHGFIAAHTDGWDAFVADLERQDLRTLVETAGVTMGQVEWLAQLVARARTMVSVWSMGLTQQRSGPDNVAGIAHLHLARGAIGKPLSGLFPIRGHSGVQGGSECGLTPTRFPGGTAIGPESAAKLGKLWGHAVPDQPGLDTGAMIEAAHEGALDVLYTIGGNLYATLPDPGYVERAFSRIRLRVHQDININTSTLIEPGGAVLLLPAQTRYEQRGGGTTTTTERRIRFTPEIEGHPVVGEARPEFEIPALVAIAARPELEPALLFESSQAIRTEIGHVMPLYAGIENLRREGDSIQWGGPHLGAGGRFSEMPGNRARFVPLTPPSTERAPGEFLLTSRRGKQFNSMVFGAEDPLQGGEGRHDVFVSEEDARSLGVADGSRVRLHNPHGEMVGVVRVERIKEGHLQAYWPEANVLVPRVFDPRSGTPEYHTTVCVEKL